MVRGEDVRPHNGPEHHRAETAGRLMSRHVPFAGPVETVAALRHRMAESGFDILDPIIAVDASGHYQGVIRLAGLLDGDGERPAHALLDPHWPSVPPAMDQEHVAELARAKRLVGVPVVTKSGEAVGCISATRLLDVLWREHTEDLHRIAGIMKPMDLARQALDEPPQMRAWHRLPWLGVGLVGSSIATAVMAGFEATFAANVKLAFFVPAIVYLADAIGTQTEAVAVRGLSLSHRPFSELLTGEAAAGALIGLVLAVFVFLGVAAAFQDMRLATAVSLSILAAGTIAATVGLALPWILSRWGLDPAFGSGPLATIVQDVLSILIYLGAVTLVMPGTQG
jgi:magnesium transporter